MTAHEPNPDQRRTAARNKPSKPPEGGSPLGRLDAEALDSQRAHERDLADRGARPVEDREPGTPVYPPFGQSGVPLVDDNGAQFPEETQQLFREVAQDAYLRGIRDQREREQAGKRRKCTSGHYLTDEGAHGEGQTWCGAGPEPVGPYAPTRDGRTLNARYEADPGLFEAGYRQGWRERDINGVPRYPDLTKWDGTYGGRGDHPDTVAELKRIRETEFERGWQQGDADRAQRGQTEFERGRASVQRSPLVTSELEGMFERGKTVGAAERESELLDQGWTPPGAVHELEVTSYPTEYEVWRDALTLSVTNVFPIDGTGEGALTDLDRKAQILAEAEWWRANLLVQVREATDDQAEITRLIGIIDSIRKATHELEGLALMSAVSAFCNAAERKI